jgi:hypothetical protein
MIVLIIAAHIGLLCGFRFRYIRDAEMLEFLAAAREAGRTNRRQRRPKSVAEKARVSVSGRQSSPLRRQRSYSPRKQSPSAQKGVAWGRRPPAGSVNATGSMAFGHPPAGDHAEEEDEEWARRDAAERSVPSSAPAAQKGVNWGEPPARGSFNEIGGMALQRPPSPVGSPHRPSSPHGNDEDEQDEQEALEATTPHSAPAATARMYRLASPQNSPLHEAAYGGSRHSRRSAADPNEQEQEEEGRMYAEESYEDDAAPIGHHLPSGTRPAAGAAPAPAPAASVAGARGGRTRRDPMEIARRWNQPQQRGAQGGTGKAGKSPRGSTISRESTGRLGAGPGPERATTTAAAAAAAGSGAPSGKPKRTGKRSSLALPRTHSSDRSPLLFYHRPPASPSALLAPCARQPTRSTVHSTHRSDPALCCAAPCGAGLPMSPRKPLIWSEGLQRGARIFVEDGESPYAKQYGEIVEVRRPCLLCPLLAMPLA